MKSLKMRRNYYNRCTKPQSLLFFTLCLFYMQMQTSSSSLFSYSGGSKDGLSPSLTTVLKHHKPKELVFSEEFFELDTDIWYHEIKSPGDKNGEFQSYGNSSENSYVRDGILYIKPTYQKNKFATRKNRSIDVGQGNELFSTKEETFNPVMSARLNTRRAFAFQYGQLEIRAKVAEGDWIWPAMWLLPQQMRYGEWPVSGEIDLMECRANRELFLSNGEDIGSNQVGSTLHFGLNRNTDMWRLAHFSKNDKNGFNSKFHNFGMIWTPDEIAFTLDGDILGVVTPPQGGFWEMGNFTGPPVWSDNKMSPFDQPFYIVLNVAVGGTFGYFPDNTGPKKKPWNNTSPTAIFDFWDAREEWIPTWHGEDSALQIDYIRIWAL